jgi:hypothetical protein
VLQFGDIYRRAAMNAYLFSAGYTTTAIRSTPGRGGQMVDSLQTWDGCSSGIIYGGDVEAAQKRFEALLIRSPNPERPDETAINRIVGAQIVDRLFTESGDQPLDWPKLAQEHCDPDQCAPADEFEQGYWVDINQVLPPGRICSDIEMLKRDLPEDIRSGLNWAPEKLFYFLITVLGASPSLEAAAIDAESAESGAADDSNADVDTAVLALPEMRDKEAVAVVKARNSVVAAWLWRKYAADTRLAASELYVSPCCSMGPLE